MVIRDDCPRCVKDLLESCWHQDPKQRPTFEEVSKQLSQIHKLRAVRSDCKQLGDYNHP